MRFETAGLEHHADDAVHMFGLVITVGTLHIGLVISLTIVGIVVTRVGREVSIGQFIILTFGDPAEGDLQARETRQAFLAQITVQHIVEQLVMAEFISSDMLADFLEDRFGGCFADRTVITRCAGFNHAARNHLAAARTTYRHGIITKEMFGSIAFAKFRHRRFQRPGRIHLFRPGSQRLAVLDFFNRPAAGNLPKILIALENAAQIIGVGFGVIFDQRRRLNDG